mgnify:FL=1
MKKYPKMYVVIVGESVVGTYEKIEDAYLKSVSTYGLGKFLIQQCVQENSVQTFISRAVFN